jgi:hypothetical protein
MSISRAAPEAADAEGVRTAGSGTSLAQRFRLREILLLALALAPLGLLAAHGALQGPLWLDEATYFQYAERPETRERAPDTPVTPAQGLLFTMFAYPNALSVYLRGLRLVGLDWRLAPEPLLRLPSLACFAAAVGLAYFATRRQGLWTALLVACALGSTPLLQFYAFEGKAYSVAGLIGLGHAVVGWRLAQRFGPRPLALYAALGLLLPVLSVWSALGLAPLPLWCGAQALAGRRPAREALLAALAALPGGLMAGLQAHWLQTDFAYQTNLWFSAKIELWPLLFGIGRDLWAGPVFLKPGPPPELVRLGLLLGAAALAAYLLCLLARPRADGAYVLFQFLVVLGLLLAAVPQVRGFVTGRYEAPLLGLGVFAAAGLPRRLRTGLLLGLVGLGALSLPWTLGRILHKSNTRPMIEFVRRHGDIGSEAVLTRYAQGWDPLHRYTGHLYAERLEPAWTAVDYPTLEPLGRDFMMFGSIARSSKSAGILARRDNPALAEWLRVRGLLGLWVLSPVSEDLRPLSQILGREGFGFQGRWLYRGHPDTWLLHFRKVGPS